MDKEIVLEVIEEKLSRHIDAVIECFSAEEEEECRKFLDLAERTWHTYGSEQKNKSYLNGGVWDSYTQKLCHCYNDGCYFAYDDDEDFDKNETYRHQALAAEAYYTWTEVAAMLSEPSSERSGLKAISNDEFEVFLYG